jgi:UDP-N-acetylmuramoyl-tripeptide--D-alanyl-D-alanine ligase
LSTRHFTLMTPESVNTPLGIAAVIGRLTAKHSVFIVELGEQKPGDLKRLMRFVRPDIVVVTPIGFVHSEHFGSEKRLVAAFGELNDARFGPNLFVVDDRNQGKFEPSAEAIWYGIDADSSFRLAETRSVSLETKAAIHAPGFFAPAASPLLGQHQLVNLLPGLAILNLDQPIEKLMPALSYAPAVPRRLEVHANPNGTTVIDNSYNTNPGSWKEMAALIESLSLGKVVIITAGFVELDAAATNQEHEKLAAGLKKLSAGTVLLRTRHNETLRSELAQYAKSHPAFRYGEADTLDEALAIISREQWPLDVIWLEGGCRELYQ